MAEEPAEEIVTVGDALPQFSVQLSDGGVFDTATLGGRPSLIIFFNTTCPDCQRTLPEVQEVYETYKSELTFVAISLNYRNKNKLVQETFAPNILVM